jgi:hypothetical protein
LTIGWTVRSLEAKPKIQGGLIESRGLCTNQDNLEVANADAKMLVHNA